MSTPDIIAISPHGCLLSIDTNDPKMAFPALSVPVPKCPRLDILKTPPAVVVVKGDNTNHSKSNRAKCNFEGGCNKYPSFGNPSTRICERCSTHKTPGMIDVVHEYCKEENCTTRSGYNIPGETRGIYCKIHKKPGMVNVVSTKCQENNCTTQAGYNLLGETKALYCSAHKKPGMVNIKSHKCHEDNCIKQPHYNLPGETKGKYCVTHKQEGMIDVIGKKCQDPDCTTHPGYNVPGETKGIYCAVHKQEGMIDVIGKKCQDPGCIKRPCYNLPGEKRGIYCVTHKKLGMIDVKNKRCQEPDCPKQASYNLPGEKRGTYCATHKKPGMFHIGSKLCQENNCTTIPSYNLPGETKGLYCVAHKKPDMIDVINKKCQEPDCPTRAGYGKLFGPKVHCVKHKSQHEYKDNHPKCSASGCSERPLYTDKGNNYPLRCETHRLQQDKNVIERPCSSCKLFNFINEVTMMCNDCTEFFVGKNNRGEKERRVREVIEAQVHRPLGLKFLVVDRLVPDGCSKRRPDTATDYSHSIAVVETDENMHRIYSHDCEIARMGTIHQDFGGIPVIFIRYNPDSYKVNGVTIRKKQNREQVLVRLMHDLRNIKVVKYPLLVCYLFYDEFDERIIKFLSIDYTKNPIEIKVVTDMFE